jgi:hypothetical protein
MRPADARHVGDHLDLKVVINAVKLHFFLNDIRKILQSLDGRFGTQMCGPFDEPTFYVFEHAAGTPAGNRDKIADADLLRILDKNSTVSAGAISEKHRAFARDGGNEC